MMRIGILGCFYNCADLLPGVLAPWLELKQEGAPFVLAGINAQFKEYAELGYANDDDATRATLEKYRDQFDLLHFETTPLPEAEVRNIGLRYLLSQEVDAIWMLDGDELYTKEQILNIINYVEKTPQFDYYHINFDQWIFGNIHWENGFCPPRIIRTDRSGGINEFFSDNDISFKDGTDLYKHVPGIVPKRVAHILHHTWRKTDVEKKIAYQRNHFGFSTFTYDAHTGNIGIDEAYYRYYKMPLPEIRNHSLCTIYRHPARLILELSNIPDSNDALVTLLSALLALERQVEYDIYLLVRADPALHTQIQSLLDICPFECAVEDVHQPLSKAGAALRLNNVDVNVPLKVLVARLREHFTPEGKSNIL